MKQLSSSDVWMRVVYLVTVPWLISAVLYTVGVNLKVILWLALAVTLMQLTIYAIDDKKGDK